VMLKHRRVLTLRSMAPLAFVVGTAVLIGATLRFPAARRLLALQWGLYGSAAVAFGMRSLQERNEPMGLLPRVMAAFPAFHLGHGSGQVVGWLHVLRRLLR
jgi:hypothetical protein